MNWKKTIYWAPRVLTILFTILISILAFDVFAENYKWYEKIVGFLIHLVPTYALLIMLWLANRRGVLGGIFFILLGLAYMALWSARDNFEWPIFLLIPLPLFVIGILFICTTRLPKN